STSVVTVALTTGTGTLAGTLTKQVSSGVADFSGQGLAIDLIGANKVLTFTTTGGVTSTTTSPAFSITLGAASKLVVTTQPSASTAAAVAFAQRPIVGIEDFAYTTLFRSSTSVVTVALTTGTGTL